MTIADRVILAFGNWFSEETVRRSLAKRAMEECFLFGLDVNRSWGAPVGTFRSDFYILPFKGRIEIAIRPSIAPEQIRSFARAYAGKDYLCVLFVSNQAPDELLIQDAFKQKVLLVFGSKPKEIAHWLKEKANESRCGSWPN
ncbi:MAG: hypothetical protein Q8P13_02450 [bacterium]|nr:hypothetical protein [bacterium]